MRAGASDFLVRPVAPERLLEALATNADRRRAAGELAPLVRKARPALALEQLIGAAPDFRTALAVAAKAARNRLPDPDRRRTRHRQGNHRPRDPFRQPSRQGSADRARLQGGSAPNIIDSELFGHEPGAFPGAFAAKIGKLVEADGGTLLLDEIAALPVETQERLDRVLATGEVRPVGLNGSYSVDVRVIATSSRALPDDFHPGLRGTASRDHRHLAAIA